jgi:hypothetical protein
MQIGYKLTVNDKGNSLQEKRYIAFVRLWYDAFHVQRTNSEMELDEILYSLKNLSKGMASEDFLRWAIDDRLAQVYAIREKDNIIIITITKCIVDN